MSYWFTQFLLLAQDAEKPAAPAQPPAGGGGLVELMLPMLIIFFFAQRYFIEGIQLTGLKG